MGNSSGKRGQGGYHQQSAAGAQSYHQQYQPAQPPLGPAPSFFQTFEQKYGFIPDNFSSFDQVQESLRAAGLESSNLIVGVDFTKSNEWTGKKTFGGRSLHSVTAGVPNPYDQAITIIGETLAAFDEDNLIPAYGFGDASTHASHVFSFNPNNQPCRGFDEVLRRYREIAPRVNLSGPTSFAPIVEAAVRTVEESGGQYHVLLIIADGQVTRSVDLPPGQLSEFEQATVDAIVAASHFALSIVMVGVGDGPWDEMIQFDNALGGRTFDNFQFVDFHRLMSYGGSQQQRAAQFALAALMEVPFQFRACAELGLIGKRVGHMPPRAPLEPPSQTLQSQATASAAAHAAHGYGGGGLSASAPVPPPNECPVCLSNPRDTVFQCGHQVCKSCSQSLNTCPICRQPIATRIRMYT